MRISNIAKFVLTAALMMGSTQVEAQGAAVSVVEDRFFELMMGSTQVEAQGSSKYEAEKALSALSSALDEDTKTPTVTKEVLEKIPTFSIQKINVEDKKNADGTDVYQYRLVDQDGKLWSEEKANIMVKTVNKFVLTATAMVGIGVVGGILNGGGGGALAGAAAGALLSKDLIKYAVKMKKSLKQQKKLLEEYQKNFDDEGLPRDASVNTSKIAGSATLSMKAEQIKNAIASDTDKKDALEALNAVANMNELLDKR